MIFYLIGAALVIAAAWASSEIVTRKSLNRRQEKRIAQLMVQIRHLENALQSYKEARDYWKEKYRDEHADLVELKSKNLTPDQP